MRRGKRKENRKPTQFAAKIVNMVILSKEEQELWTYDPHLCRVGGELNVRGTTENTTEKIYKRMWQIKNCNHMNSTFLTMQKSETQNKSIS